MKLFLAPLLFISLSAYASTVDFRKACQLKKSTDVILVTRITSSSDACEGIRCFAGIYRGTIEKRTGKDRSVATNIGLTTSAGLIVGQEYLLFAKRISGEDIAFNGPGETVFYKVPADVMYYIPPDGAFIKTYRGYFRTVWKWCHGDGPECTVINDIDKDLVLSADVLYKNLEEELSSCQ